jgi:hypothetical protein
MVPSLVVVVVVVVDDVVAGARSFVIGMPLWASDTFAFAPRATAPIAKM